MSKSSQLTLGKWSPKGCGGISLLKGQEVVSRLTVAHAILYPHVLNLNPKNNPPYESVTYKYDGGLLPQHEGQWFVHKDFVHGGLDIALWVKRPFLLPKAIAMWRDAAKEVPTISHHDEVFVSGSHVDYFGRCTVKDSQVVINDVGYAGLSGSPVMRNGCIVGMYTARTHSPRLTVARAS